MSSTQKKIGPYTVEGVLGKGCMGVVYKVRHPELGRYALKVLRTELSSERDLKRFKREIELLAAISEHPNVVKIHTAAEDRGRIYYVMDLIQGEDLQAKLKHGPLKPRQAARYVQQIASAVAVLHKKGILHRDIKPANVIVDDRDRARLSDFGLARSFTDDQSRLTLSGEFVGTPLFMAPEQATGKGAGPEADVYALGMVLYTLLAGRPAIQGSSTAEVLQKLRAGAHKPLRKLVPEVSPLLADLVMRTLSMDPRTRPRDAGQLARELGRFVEEKAAQNEGAVEKQKLVLALVAALVVLVVVGGGAFVLLRGGEGAAVAAAGGEGQVEATFEAAREAIQHGEPSAELLARIVAVRDELIADDEESMAKLAKAGELWGLEGELRLQTGELAQARVCLAEAEKIADPEGATLLRNLSRRGLAGLRAGLGALDPQPEDELVGLLQALQAAERLYPDRLELLDWRVAISVRFERWEEAQKVLGRHPVPDRLDSALRARIFLAAGNLDQAEGLVGEVNDDALLGELRYRQGRQALNGEEWVAAREYFEEAVAQDPNGAEREVSLAAVRELYQDNSDWRSANRRSRLARLVRLEVAIARAVRALDGQFALPRARYDLIFRSMAEVGRELEGKTLDLLEDLVSLREADITLYKLYGAVAEEWGFPNYQREMEILRRGYQLAKHPRDKEQLAKSLATGYYFKRDVDALLALESDLPRGVSGARRAYVVGRAGDLFRWQGNLKRATELLDRAQEFDDESFEVALFRHYLGKERVNQSRDPAAHTLAVDEGWKFLTLYEGAAWHAELPAVAVWLAKAAVSSNDTPRAIEALLRLREFRPDQLHWEAYRLELVASLEPWPEDFAAQVDNLKDPGLEHALKKLSEAAQAASGDRRAALRTRIDSLRKVSVDHLGQAAAIGDRDALLRGLQNLQKSLKPLLDDLS